MPKKSNSFLQRTRSGWKRIHVANKTHSPLYEELKPGTLVEVAGKGLVGRRDQINRRTWEIKPEDEFRKIPELANRVAGMSIIAKDKMATKEDVFKMLGDRLQGTGIKSLNRM